MISALSGALYFFSHYRGLNQVPHECHTTGQTLRCIPVSSFFFLFFFFLLFYLGMAYFLLCFSGWPRANSMYVSPRQDLNLKPSRLALPYTRVSIPRHYTFVMLSEYCTFVLNQLVQTHEDLLALMKDIRCLFANISSLKPGIPNFCSDFPTRMYFQYSNGKLSSPWFGSWPWMGQQGKCGYLRYISMRCCFRVPDTTWRLSVFNFAYFLMLTCGEDDWKDG